MSLDHIKKYADFETITDGDKNNIILPGSLSKFVSQIGALSLKLEWSAEFITLYGEDDIDEMQSVYSNDLGLYVVGDIISNPIFFKTNIDYELNIAKHGMGNIKLEPIAGNIGELIDIFDVYVSLYYVDFNKKILNEDYEVLEEFKERLVTELAGVTDENCISTIIKFL